MSTNKSWSAAIILALVAALVLVLNLYINSKAQSYQVTKQTVAAQAQQTFEWKLVTSWPKGFPGLGTAPENFSKLVEQMSAGRLLIKVYGAGEFVPALGVFDAVSQGSAEMGHSGAYFWKGKSASAPFFTSVPFGLTAQEMNAWLHHRGGLELWQKSYEKFNLIPLAGGNTGVQMAGWFNREINSIADLKGLKMRIPGLGGEVFNRAGGTSVTIAGGELYTSLKTGVIDATEWVGPYNDLAFGLHEVAKYYYYPGWHEPGPTLELTVNKTAFEGLPADLQQIIRTAARAVNQDMLDEYTANNNAALQQLVEQHQVQLKPLPDEVLKHLHSIANEVIAEFASQDPETQAVYDSYMQFARQVKQYHKISEQAYINARDL